MFLSFFFLLQMLLSKMFHRITNPSTALRVTDSKDDASGRVFFIHDSTSNDVVELFDEGYISKNFLWLGYNIIETILLV